MKYLVFVLATVLGATGVSPAIAAPAFYGTWACAQMIDNRVNTTDWTQEVYGVDGVSVGTEGKAAPLKVRTIRKGLFDLVYANGARARIDMKEPWLFTRGTMEHSYICLRTGP